jgi:hypothetical protein
MTELDPQIADTDTHSSTPNRGLFDQFPRLRTTLGSLAALSVLTTGVTACASGEITKITLQKNSQTVTMPERYYAAVAAAGNICGAITEQDIVAQLAVEDGPPNWPLTVTSETGAEGPAQWEPYVFAYYTKKGIISGGSISNLYDAVDDMGELDCYNAKRNDGSANAAMQIYNSGHNGGAPQYAALVLQIAQTVNIGYDGSLSSATGIETPEQTAFTSPFARLLAHDGYTLTSASSKTASAPFPKPYIACPQLVFHEQGATFSIRFAGVQNGSAVTPPDGLDALQLKNFEQAHNALCAK